MGWDSVRNPDNGDVGGIASTCGVLTAPYNRRIGDAGEPNAGKLLMVEARIHLADLPQLAGPL